MSALVDICAPRIEQIACDANRVAHAKPEAHVELADERKPNECWVADSASHSSTRENNVWK
jgi:hypothetical protein